MPYCGHCGAQIAEVSYRPCPVCGQPSNGAARGEAPPQLIAPARRSNAALIIIGVVLGAFFLIAMLGIIAAIAIPNFLTATERSKQKRTMADLRSIATAVEAYAVDNNHYPDVKSPTSLAEVISPTYIREVPRTDGWLHPLRYECFTKVTPCDTYFVASGGKDGAFEHDPLNGYTPRATNDFNADLVYSNGNFVQYPEGVGGQ